MKILVATSGPIPARDRAGYIINIAKRLGAEIVALHTLQQEDWAIGKEALSIYAEAGREANVQVAKILKKGDIARNIVDTAEEELVDLIIMGTSDVETAGEWISESVMEKTKIPVVVVPHGLKNP